MNSWLNWSTRRKLAIVLSSLLVLFIAPSSYYGFQLSKDFQQWQADHLNVSTQEGLLSDILSHLGYGHGIHAFKNMILRQDIPTYYAAAVSDFEVAIEKCKSFASLTYTPESQKKLMHQVISSLEKFRAHTDRAKELIESGMSSREIDQQVKVNDATPIESIQTLINQIKEQRHRIDTNFYSTLFASLITLLAYYLLGSFSVLLIVFFFGKSISDPIHQLMNSASQISAGDLSTSIPVDLNGDFAKLASTMEIMRTELKNVIENLERSNKELEQFAYAASHDLQEPVRKIITFSSLLQESLGSELSEDENYYITRVIDASARMRLLIEDLLALSRVSAQPRDKKEVPLKEMAQEAWQELELLVSEKKGQLMIENDLPVLCDSSQFRRLLQNLFINSLKFCKETEPPIIEISSQKDDATQTINLCIKDNGIGFSQEQAKRIFNPFQRLHHRSKFDGNGIGLTIVKKIVDSHNGQIHATAQPGLGCQFHISLPGHRPRRPFDRA